MIADSTFIIDHLLERDEAMSFTKKLGIDQSIQITSISVYEIIRGIKNTQERNTINVFCLVIQIDPIKYAT